MGIREEYFKKYVNCDNDTYSANELIDTPKENKAKPIWYYISTEEGKSQMLEEIHNIMEYIDFEKIHDTMVALDWKWFDCPNVPDIPRIKEQLLCMLSELFENTDGNDGTKYRTSTAGFTVGYKIYPPEDNEPDDFAHCVDVYVYFAVEEYRTFD